MYDVGFIGYGLRAEYMMRAFEQMEIGVRIAAVADPRFEALREQYRDEEAFEGTAWFPDANAMLAASQLQGIFIGTRCGLHTPLATRALETGLPLFLEKPVCINEEQYRQLAAAGKGKEGNVLVSFPLRFSPIIQEMHRILRSGELGDITMVQAVNNVPYGNVYYHSWYRDASLTGGLFLQKATHDIDTIRFLLGKDPVTAFAMASKLYFKGEKPANLHCPDCAEYRTCEESSYVQSKLRGEEVPGDACCFAVDTGNEDTASALFQTADGVIISYSQCFTVKKSAGRRGARFIGTKGSVEFDFYTGIIRRDCYRTNQTVCHDIKPVYPQHFGGDAGLALAFHKLLEGKHSAANLRDGLYSAACCLAAKRSAETGASVPILY